MALSPHFGLETACAMVDSLKKQGMQALDVHICESDTSTSIHLAAIKDYFAYTNGNNPVASIKDYFAYTNGNNPVGG